MRTTLFAVVVALSVPAAAEPDEPVQVGVNVGVGGPTGGIGIGLRDGPLDAFGEVQFLAIGPALVTSATVHVHYELVQLGRWGLYIGPAGGILATLVGGAEGDSGGAWAVAGVVLGVRFHQKAKRVHDFEVGALYGTSVDRPCTDSCQFVGLQVAWRLHFYR
ncbi:hypothetical protein BH11MYX2_BH11MYX2_20070 [soil metagenome]